jgi:deazaflavin-dependent oxidoreductase (nitroreductase family)
VLIYRGPLADFLKSRCVMLLTTRGRRTGRPRTNGVSFMPLDDHYVTFSGWGVRSDWYRNVVTNPEVFITVGRRRMRAVARLVKDPARRRDLMLQMQRHSARCGPPQRVRRLLKLSGMFDYDAEITMAVAAGAALPVVEIFPQR